MDMREKILISPQIDRNGGQHKTHKIILWWNIIKIDTKIYKVIYWKICQHFTRLYNLMNDWPKIYIYILYYWLNSFHIFLCVMEIHPFIIHINLGVLKIVWAVVIGETNSCITLCATLIPNDHDFPKTLITNKSQMDYQTR